MAAAGAVVAGAAGLMALGSGTASADTTFDDVGSGSGSSTSSFESSAPSFGSVDDMPGLGTDSNVGSASSAFSPNPPSSSPTFDDVEPISGSPSFDLGPASGPGDLVAGLQDNGSDPLPNVSALSSPSFDSVAPPRTDPQPVIEPTSVFNTEPLSPVAQSSFTDPEPPPSSIAPMTALDLPIGSTPGSDPAQLSPNIALGPVDAPTSGSPSNLGEMPTLPAAGDVAPPTVLASGPDTDPLDGGTIGLTDRKTTEQLDKLLGLSADPAAAPTFAPATMLDVSVDPANAGLLPTAGSDVGVAPPTGPGVTIGQTDPETTAVLDRALLGNGGSSLFAPGQTWSDATDDFGPPTTVGSLDGPEPEFGFLGEQDSDALDRLLLPATGGSADEPPLFPVVDPDRIAWGDAPTTDDVATEQAPQPTVTAGGMYRPTVTARGLGTGRNSAELDAFDTPVANPGGGLLDPSTARKSDDIRDDRLGSAALGAGGKVRLPQLPTGDSTAQPSSVLADGTVGTPAPGGTPTGSGARSAGTTPDADATRRFQEALGYSAVGVPFALGVGTAFRMLDPTLNGSIFNAFQAAASRAPTGFGQDLFMLGGAGGIPISGDRDLDRYLHSQAVDTTMVTAADMALRRINPVINNYGAANPNMRGSSWLRNARLDSGLPWWALASIGPTLGAANYTIDSLETDAFGFGVDANGRPVPQNNTQYYADRAARDGALGATIGTLANVSLRNRQLPQQVFDRAAALPGQINNTVRRLAGQAVPEMAPATLERAFTRPTVTSVPRWASVAGLLAPFVLPPIQQFVTNRVLHRPPQRDGLDDVIDGFNAGVVQPLSNTFGSDTVQQTAGVVNDAVAGCVSGLTTKVNCVAGAVAGAGLAFRDRTTLGRNATQDVITSDGTVGDAFTDNVGAVVGQAGNVLDTGLNGLSAGLATIAAPLVPLHELLQDGRVRPVSLEERLQFLAEEPSVQATNASATEYVNNIGRIMKNSQTMLTGTARGGLNMLRTGNWETPAPTHYSDCSAPGQVQCLTPGTNRLVVGSGAPTRVDNTGRTMTQFYDCSAPGQSQCVTPGTNRLVVGSGAPTRVDDVGRTVTRQPDCNTPFQVQCVTPGTNRLVVGSGRDTTTLPDGRTVENVTIDSLRQEVESRTPADYQRAFQIDNSGASAPSPALVNPVTQMQQQVQDAIGTQAERLGNTFNRAVQDTGNTFNRAVQDAGDTFNRAVQDTGNTIQRGSDFVQGWTNDRGKEARDAWNNLQQILPWNPR